MKKFFLQFLEAKLMVQEHIIVHDPYLWSARCLKQFNRTDIRFMDLEYSLLFFKKPLYPLVPKNHQRIEYFNNWSKHSLNFLLNKLFKFIYYLYDLLLVAWMITSLASHVVYPNYRQFMFCFLSISLYYGMKLIPISIVNKYRLFHKW